MSPAKDAEEATKEAKAKTEETEFIPKNLKISETTIREAITITEIGFEDEPTIAVTFDET
jgi:hypothetical protein